VPLSWAWAAQTFAPGDEGYVPAALRALSGREGLVVYGHGVWDVAFAGLAAARAGLDDVHAALNAAFPPPAGGGAGGARLVWRTPNYFCCASTRVDGGWVRWYTAGRYEALVELAAARFRAARGGTGGRVWDVFGLWRALPLERHERQFDACGSGHDPATDVHAQVQLLLNVVCDG